MANYNRSDSTLKGLYYTLFCFSLIALLTFIADLFFKKYGWVISIGIANIVFLNIIRLLPVESLVGANIIEKYWAKVKEDKIDLILINCTSKKSNNKIILSGCVKDIHRLELEALTKSSFLAKDTQVFIAGFKSDIVYLILGSIFVLLISYFGSNDFSNVYHVDQKWDKKAIEAISKLKNSIEVTVIISSVIVQLAFLLRTPFLLEMRNRAYIVENNCTEE